MQDCVVDRMPHQQPAMSEMNTPTRNNSSKKVITVIKKKRKNATALYDSVNEGQMNPNDPSRNSAYPGQHNEKQRNNLLTMSSQRRDRNFQQQEQQFNPMAHARHMSFSSSAKNYGYDLNQDNIDIQKEMIKNQYLNQSIQQFQNPQLMSGQPSGRNHKKVINQTSSHIQTKTTQLL